MPNAGALSEAEYDATVTTRRDRAGHVDRANVKTTNPPRSFSRSSRLPRAQYPVAESPCYSPATYFLPAAFRRAAQRAFIIWDSLRRPSGVIPPPRRPPLLALLDFAELGLAAELAVALLVVALLPPRRAAQRRRAASASFARVAADMLRRRRPPPPRVPVEALVLVPPVREAVPPNKD